jgi:hypothetical protein
VAATLKVAVCPGVIAWSAGWVVMAGAVTAGWTISLAASLSTAPAGFETTTEKIDPLSCSVAGVV